MQERRTRPALVSDFHIFLAEAAQDRGLRLFRDGSRWYCTSASRPGEAHYVTGLGCTCPSFVSHQRCTHHGLLLERLGWLPEFESTGEFPQLVATSGANAQEVDCFSCTSITYRSFEKRRPHRGGSGIRPDHRLRDVPAGEVVATAA